MITMIFIKRILRIQKCFFFYVNGDNELETINKINYILDNNSKITKDNIIKVIKENQYKNNKKYKVKHIVKYNITLEPDEIIHMLNVDNKEGYNFISNVSYNNDIHFSDTICILQDLNSLYIIFTEINKQKSLTNTRKIRMRKPIKSNNIDNTRRKRV